MVTIWINKTISDCIDINNNILWEFKKMIFKDTLLQKYIQLVGVEIIGFEHYDYGDQKIFFLLLVFTPPITLGRG